MFTENGRQYLNCKSCLSEYVEISNEDVISVTCPLCVTRKCLEHMPIEKFYPSLKKNTSDGKPTGWHFMKVFVDKNGTVYHKGIEQPDLKGTLPTTKVKPRKKKKKKDKDDFSKTMQLAKEYKEKQKLKKAIEKQKDFIDGKVDKS